MHKAANGMRAACAPTVARRSLLASAVLGVAACAHQMRVIEAGEPLSAFVGVTVIPAYGAARLRDHTIAVRGDRIIAVAPDNQVVLPANATRIGRRGQIVAPGLADMHTHTFARNDGALFLANGITTVRNLAGRPDTVELAARIDAGALPGPRIYSSGPIIDLSPPRPDAPALRSPADIERVVNAQADAGYIAIKLYDQLTPDLFAAAVAAARARGLQVYAHVPLSMSLREVLALHIDSIEHLFGFDRALAPRSSSDWDEQRWSEADASLIAPLAAEVAQSGVWNTATLTLMESTRAFADIEAADASPLYRYATARLRALWRSQAQAAAAERPPAVAWAVTQRAHAMRLAVVRALHGAGAPLLIGTDAPQPYTYPGFSLHDELGFHRDAGLPLSAILRIASADAARFLRNQGEFGVLAEGARADLLLLDGDPEADLAHLRAPAGVMAAGRWRDAAALAALLEEAAQRAGEAGSR